MCIVIENYLELGNMTKLKREKLLRQPGYFWCKLYRKEFLNSNVVNQFVFQEKCCMKIPHFIRWQHLLQKL